MPIRLHARNAYKAEWKTVFTELSETRRSVWIEIKKVVKKIILYQSVYALALVFAKLMQFHSQIHSYSQLILTIVVNFQPFLQVKILPK